MKSRIYRIVAFLAVSAVLSLQALWMVYTFVLFVQRGSGQIADSLFAFFSDNWLLILASVLIDMAIIVGIVEHIRFAERQKRLDDIRKDFSSAMIHDMKSPLSSIVMGIKALQSGKLDGKPDIKRQYYRIVEEEAEHLLGLTNRLLAISKLESHNLVLSKAEVELRPMLEDVIDKFRAKTKKKMTVKMSLNADSVWGDAELIKEIFVNLIDNAVKYSKDEIVIRIESYHNNGTTLVSVRDNGQGIAHDELPFVFDKFARATTQGNSPGFGLGLNYVYQVMQAHEGRVTVESRKGEYTQFVLLFHNKVAL